MSVGAATAPGITCAAVRICVLSSSYAKSASEFRDHDPYRDPTPYFGPDHTVEHCLLDKATAVRQIQALARRPFDVFVNLCDGAWDEDRAGIEVVQALERLDLPFTGAGSAFYEPTREAMKRACWYAGLATPPSVVVDGAADVPGKTCLLRHPLIVKHPNSYGSVGLTPASRVENDRDLAEQVDRMAAGYGQALVEEFIEGREFTALVAEDPEHPRRPVVFTPSEVHFTGGETFKHFQLKWVDFASMEWSPVTDPDLAARLRAAAAAMFTALGGDGYGRCDLRMDTDGEIYVLEINPNCGVFYPPPDLGSADIILTHDPGGHERFVDLLLRSAQARHRRRSPWTVERCAAGGYGLAATTAIGAGEVIERYEERPHHLVSRTHVERTWTAEQQRWFAQYAYPLTDDLFVMWSDRPQEWKPVNHSCDPNAWLDGLDLVARRPIARGEPIAIDYATFCGPTMEAFACRCGSGLCRGTIRGADGLDPSVLDRYGDHVSDYVRQRRRRMPRG